MARRSKVMFKPRSGPTVIGKKTEVYFTKASPSPSLRSVVIEHTVINELHATKGWRTVQREQKTISFRQFIEKDKEFYTITFDRYRAPRQRQTELHFKDEAARERSLLRHGWYRRKLRKEAMEPILVMAARHGVEIHT